MQGQETSAPQKLNAEEIVTLTARLAQLMAEEVDCLAAMKVKKIQELQKEKLYLVAALEKHKKLIEKFPQLSETIPSQDREDLKGVIAVFNDVLEENHRRLNMAREVNRHIVGAITDAVREHTVSKVYGGSGRQGALGSDAMSITLNQTA